MGKGGKGKGKPRFELGPVEWVEKAGTVMHECEGQLIVKCTHAKVPKFNARICLENMSVIGKVDDIFGPVNSFLFSVTMEENQKAKAFKVGSDVFIDGPQTLPLDKFLPSAPQGGGKGKGKGKGKGGDKGKGKGGKGKGFGKGKGKGVKGKW